VEEQFKIAVFIDYDNIEIGVKTTLGREFDVRIVLEGLKERGEIVSKTAYANWSRHGTAARAFSEQGVQMVQRDATPMGDKNGADINLALDALEMAFTRDHINAFAIISGDSDFMPLVNKLKQFNKRVYIVGGKAFTSTILQRNCHEFVSYESLLDSQSPRSRRGGGSGQRGRSRRSLPLERAVPLVDRTLQSLDRRGVQPQLGLLKSTMQQLDSAFDERNYGVSSFSSFVEKLVDEGFLAVRTVGGQIMVERRVTEEKASNGTGTRDQEDAIRMLGEVLETNLDILAMGIPAREVEAVVTAADPDFKETDYGFSEFAEVLNYAHDKRLVRVEADLEHGLRYYPGDELVGSTEHFKQAAKEASEADAKTESAASDADRGEVTTAAEKSEGEAAPKPRRSRAPARGRGRRTSRSRSSSSRKRAVSGDAPPPDTGDAAAPPDTADAAPPPDTVDAAPPPDTVDAAPPPDTVDAAPPPDTEDAAPPPDTEDAPPPPPRRRRAPTRRPAGAPVDLDD